METAVNAEEVWVQQCVLLRYISSVGWRLSSLQCKKSSKTRQFQCMQNNGIFSRELLWRLSIILSQWFFTVLSRDIKAQTNQMCVVCYTHLAAEFGGRAVGTVIRQHFLTQCVSYYSSDQREWRCLNAQTGRGTVGTQKSVWTLKTATANNTQSWD